MLLMSSQLRYDMDHSTQKLYIFPPGGTDTDKQNSMQRPASLCFSKSI